MALDRRRRTTAATAAASAVTSVWRSRSVTSRQMSLLSTSPTATALTRMSNAFGSQPAHAAAERDVWAKRLHQAGVASPCIIHPDAETTVTSGLAWAPW